MLKEFESSASLPEEQYAQSIAIIAPHAGYVYSGSIAAYGYRALKKGSPKESSLMDQATMHPLRESPSENTIFIRPL